MSMCPSKNDLATLMSTPRPIAPVPATHKGGSAIASQRPVRLWFLGGGLLIAALSLAVYFFFKDVPPPDDADYLPRWTEGGGAANPLATFIRGIKARANWGFRPRLDYETGYSSADNSELTDILAGSDFVLPLFDTLMTSDPASWRWHDAHGVSASGVPEDNYLCYEVSNTLWGKAELHRLRSESKEALDTALSIHRFGHGLVMAEGNGLNLGWALQIQDIALSGITLALSSEISPARLKLAQDELAGREIQNAHLAMTLRSDYALLKPTVLDAADSSKPISASFFPKGREYSRLWFQPNRTLQQQLDVRRLMESELDKDWAKAIAYADVSMSSSYRTTELWLAHPNFAGERIMSDMMSWGLLDVVRNTAIQISKQRILVTGIAIRRFELEHGSLPASLHELVPYYMPTLPVDPMHRLPIQWDLVRRELRAVGLIRTRALYFGPSPDGDVIAKLWWKS
jgi:hypothetical protein